MGAAISEQILSWIGEGLLENLILVASVGYFGHVCLTSINLLKPFLGIFLIWDTKEEELSSNVIWGRGVTGDLVKNNYKETSVWWERMELSHTDAQRRGGEKKESGRIIIPDSKYPWDSGHLCPSSNHVSREVPFVSKLTQVRLIHDE